MPTSPWKLPAMMALAIALSPLCTAAAQQAPVVEYRCYVADQRLPEAEGHVRHISYMTPRPTAEALLHGKACLYFPYSLTGKGEKGTSAGKIYHYFSDDKCPGKHWSCLYNNLQSVWSLFPAEVPELSKMTADNSLYLKHLWGQAHKRPPSYPTPPNYISAGSWWIEPYNVWSCLRAHKKKTINDTLPQLEGDIWIFPGPNRTMGGSVIEAEEAIAHLSAEEAVQPGKDYFSLQKKNDDQQLLLRYLKRSTPSGGKTGVYPIFEPAAKETVLKKLDTKLRTAVLFTALCDHFSQPGSLPVIVDDETFTYLLTGVKLQDNIPQVQVVDAHVWRKDKLQGWGPVWKPLEGFFKDPDKPWWEIKYQMALFPYLPPKGQARAYKPITPRPLADYEKIANRIWPDRRALISEQPKKSAGGTRPSSLPDATTPGGFFSTGNLLLLAVVGLALYWGVNKYRSYTANKGREGSQLYTRKGSRGA